MAGIDSEKRLKHEGIEKSQADGREKSKIKGACETAEEVAD